MYYNTMYYMSMRTIYIRKENEEYFDKLENKSEKINWYLVQLRKKEKPEPVYTEVEKTA